jgi:hypothetical protein
MTDVAVSCEGSRNDAGRARRWADDAQRTSVGRVASCASEPGVCLDDGSFGGGKLTIKCRHML